MISGYFNIQTSYYTFITGRIFITFLGNKKVKLKIDYECPPFFYSSLEEEGITQKKLLITDSVILSLDEDSLESDIVKGIIQIKNKGNGRFYIDKKNSNISYCNIL